MNVLHTTLQNALEQIQAFIRFYTDISNIVTANDCANLALCHRRQPHHGPGAPRNASDCRSCEGSHPKHRDS